MMAMRTKNATKIPMSKNSLDVFCKETTTNRHLIGLYVKFALGIKNII